MNELQRRGSARRIEGDHDGPTCFFRRKVSREPAFAWASHGAHWRVERGRWWESDTVARGAAGEVGGTRRRVPSSRSGFIGVVHGNRYLAVEGKNRPLLGTCPHDDVGFDGVSQNQGRELEEREERSGPAGTGSASAALPNHRILEHEPVEVEQATVTAPKVLWARRRAAAAREVPGFWLNFTQEIPRKLLSARAKEKQRLIPASASLELAYSLNLLLTNN
jgi:hypothetical protein